MDEPTNPIGSNPTGLSREHEAELLGITLVERPSIVGKPHPDIHAREKAMGRLQYTADLSFPGMLHGKILRSPLPHARIASIDIRRAIRLSGVKAVITGKETPRIAYGPMIADQYPLAADRVRYVGEAVAAVAAVDLETAAEALELIRVDYEPLTPVFDVEEAMSETAPLIHEKEHNIVMSGEWQRGDVVKGFQESDVVLEQRFRTQPVYQCYLEPWAAIGSWDALGRLTLLVPIHVPFLAKRSYARALGISPEKIRIIQANMGGSFGAKHEHSFHLICALLAKAADRPVRIVFTREEDFADGRPRVPMIMDLKVGMKHDGTLMAKDVRLVADSGAYASYGPSVILAAALRSDCLYRLKNLRTQMSLVYTNKLPTGCFRGFGNITMHFANESMMDMLASELGLDPIEVRLRNATKSGDTTVHGYRIGSCALTDCLKRAKLQSRWDEKRKQRRKYRGIGAAAVIHVSGNRAHGPQDGSAAFVRVGEDGRVTVFTGEVDLGEGLYTVLAQVAAEELGLAAEDVTVANVDTDLSPYGLGTWASRGTVMGGNAVKAAAGDARRKLLETASGLLDTKPEMLIASRGQLVGPDGRAVSIAEVAQQHMRLNGGAPVIGQGHFIPPGVEPPDAITKYGNISCAYPFGVQVAEVEVDDLSGLVRVVNLLAVHDVGKLVNPLGAIGQVEGGIAQGMGFALSEQMHIEGGAVSNQNLTDYKIPSTMDVPEIECSFVEPQDPFGPYGAKGLSEPAIIPTAAAIANALYNAIGVRFTELPITPEKVLAAMEKMEKYTRHG